MTTAAPPTPRRPRRSRRDRRSVFGQFVQLPASLFLVLFFALPLAQLLRTSFSVFSLATGQTSGPSLANYQFILTDPQILAALGRTLRLSLTATVVALLVGYPVASYLVSCGPRARRYLLLLVVSPLLVLVVVRTFGWSLILGPRGPIDWVVQRSGLLHGEFNLTGSDTAVVIGLVHVYLPYMVLPIFTRLSALDTSLPKAARGLGATPFRAFLRVTLPLSVPGVAAGCILVFTLSSSSFETPAVLGGFSASVLSYEVYEQAMILSNTPRAAAVSALLLTVIGLVVTAYVVLVERSRRYQAMSK